MHRGEGDALGPRPQPHEVGRRRDALDDAPAAGFSFRISHGRRDEFGAAFDSFNRAAAAVEPQLAGGPAVDEASVLATRIADMPRLAA